MALLEVMGQEKVARMLKNALKRKRLAHAYIFSGPDREGKKRLALELAKALNCTTYTDDACDHCTNCVRVSHGNHPDVHWIIPDGRSVKIEQIRALQKNFSYHSVEAAAKVFIVEAAETMTLQAANSLLKFLEEPVGVVVAVLLTENVHAMLPTVVSRCQLVPFGHLSPQMMSEQLTTEGVPPGIASVAASLASGLEEARELSGQEWFIAVPPLIAQLSKAVIERSGKALIIVQEQLMKSDIGRHYMEFFLDLMILWYQDMLSIKLGCRKPITFLEQTEEIKQHVTKWTESTIVQAIERLLFARRQLRQHVPPQLVLEGWVLSVQEG